MAIIPPKPFYITVSGVCCIADTAPSLFRLPHSKTTGVNLTFRSTEKQHSYTVYKLTYRLGYSIIILIGVCLKSDRQKITDTKSCKRKDDTVDIRRFIFSVLLYGSVLYSIFHLP